MKSLASLPKTHDSSLKRHSFLLAGLIASTLACGTVAPASAASLITNGSFENYNASQIGANGYATSWTAIDNWTGTDSDGYVTRIGINGANDQTFANNGALPNGPGSYVAFLQAPAAGAAFTTLSQSISGLVDGQAYQLTFDVNTRNQTGFGSDGAHVGVTLGTQTLLAPLYISPVDPAGTFTSPYHSESINFTYSSAWGNALTFISTTTAPSGEGTIVLDNASLVAVPEPSTVALGALGLGSLMWRLRRRKA